MFAYFAIENTCAHGGKLMPFIVNIICCKLRSNKQPRISPGFQPGRDCGSDLALYHISLRQPSYAREYLSSPIP